MRTTQAHVETTICRAVAPAAKLKTKSAGALRMARLRHSKQKLQIIARSYHDSYFDRSFRMLAEDNPNGSSIAARRWLFDAWLEAAQIPADVRKQIVETIVGK